MKTSLFSAMALALASTAVPNGLPRSGRGFSAMPSGLTASHGQHHRANPNKKAQRKAKRQARRQNRK